MGAVSLASGLFFGFGCFVLLITKFPPFGWLGKMLLAVTFELLGAALVVSALVFLWSLLTPAWIEWLFQSAWKKLWIAIAVAIIPIAILIVLGLLGVKMGEGINP